MQGQTATYRIAVRNHGPRPIGPVDVQVELPAGARLERCGAGSEGLARCTTVEERPTWALPLLFGGKSTAGPLVAVVDVSRVEAGFFEATITAASLDEPGAVRAREGTAIPQRVRLRKPRRRRGEGKSRPRFGGE